ncbi:hypothetical protein BDF21DRAFT_401901 [Thamnidium elegans]|nr:hypothetical protein BDF21DRAFT_401901 [Thamnidium elegans]
MADDTITFGNIYLTVVSKCSKVFYHKSVDGWLDYVQSRQESLCKKHVLTSSAAGDIKLQSCSKNNLKMRLDMRFMIMKHGKYVMDASNYEYASKTISSKLYTDRLKLVLPYIMKNTKVLVVDYLFKL